MVHVKYIIFHRIQERILVDLNFYHGLILQKYLSSCKYFKISHFKKLVIIPTTMNSYYVTMNCALVYLIIQDKEKI